MSLSFMVYDALLQASPSFLSHAEKKGAHKDGSTQNKGTVGAKTGEGISTVVFIHIFISSFGLSGGCTVRR